MAAGSVQQLELGLITVSVELERSPNPEQMVELVEPSYVCHGRLYFEQINSERYGWNIGVLQAPFSGLRFFWDSFLLPYHLATRPCERVECSTGKCLPGDATPLALYPPELSVTGLLAQTGAVAAGFFVFP